MWESNEKTKQAATSTALHHAVNLTLATPPTHTHTTTHTFSTALTCVAAMLDTSRSAMRSARSRGHHTSTASGHGSARKPSVNTVVPQPSGSVFFWSPAVPDTSPASPLFGLARAQRRIAMGLDSARKNSTSTGRLAVDTSPALETGATGSASTRRPGSSSSATAGRLRTMTRGSDRVASAWSEGSPRLRSPKLRSPTSRRAKTPAHRAGGRRTPSGRERAATPKARGSGLAGAGRQLRSSKGRPNSSAGTRSGRGRRSPPTPSYHSHSDSLRPWSSNSRGRDGDGGITRGLPLLSGRQSPIYTGRRLSTRMYVAGPLLATTG